MKKSISAICLLLVLCFLVSGCDTTDAVTTDAPATQSPSVSTATPVSTESGRVALEGEIIPSGEAQKVNTAIPAAQLYKEALTTADGSALYKGEVNLKVTYNSTFYGHDSAINRDYVAYATKFTYKKFKGLDASLTSYFIADMDGNRFGDTIWYADGKLNISSTSVTKKKAESDVFIADSDCIYAPGAVSQYELNEPGELRGVCDINGDGYNDLLFYSEKTAVIYFASADGYKKISYALDFDGKLFCGDADGDGRGDLIVINEYSVKIYYFAVDSFFAEEAKDIFMRYPYTQLCVADMNTDTRADIVGLAKAEDGYRIITWFGKGDGTFGPGETDDGNTNLYGLHTCKYDTLAISAGDVNGDTIPDIIAMAVINDTPTSALLYSRDEPAYDYSLFGMKINGKYYLYSGCRWYDTNTIAVENGDGDHVILSESDDGIHWKRYIDAPMFYLGWELGEKDWWTDNTLEPEVLYVDGVYHMYWQCSYTTPKGKYGDKIGYATSTDGIHWTRKTDEPAVLCDEPEIGFNHEEVIYVPDDPDGKPYWMYVGHFVDGGFRGYIRIRSADPTKFLYSDHESTSGFGQIGNQIAYVDDPTFGRVFMRITFTEAKSAGVGYSVPTFQISRDGIKFESSNRLMLAAVDQNNPLTADNKNVYFLGLVTENGTGKVSANEDGSYTMIYLATTCASPVAPQIFNAEGGVGSVTFTLSEIE